jgi:hypothetical protein
MGILASIHIGLGRPDEPEARGPDCHCLVLDHRSQPRQCGRLLEPLGAAKHDLERSLHGVISVGRA